MAIKTICGGCLSDITLVHVYDNRYKCPICGAECDWDELECEAFWDEDTYEADNDYEDIWGEND